MASVNRGSSMRGGRSRRSMSDINVVPYIDVMLVLLVIFMVTAPLVTPGTVDVPSVGKSAQAPSAYIEVMIKADKSMKVAIRGEHGQADQNLASIADLISLVKQRQAIDPASPPPVIIAADKTVQYDAVLQVMDALQKQNVKRVGLSVKPAPPGS